MMLFKTNHNNFEEDEEDGAGVDDALLGELDDEDVADDLLDSEGIPLVIEEKGSPDAEGDGEDEEEPDELAALLEDDEDDEDVDYDSFDDEDEL